MMLRHYLELAQHYRLLIAFVVIAVTGASFVIGVKNIVGNPEYEASAVVTYLPSDTAVEFSRDTQSGSRESRANFFTQTLIEYLLSRSILEITLAKIRKKFPSTDDPSAQSNISDFITKFRSLISYGRIILPDKHEAAINGFRNSVAIQTVDGSFVVRVVVTMNDPAKAAFAANGLAQAFVGRARRESENQSVDVVSFFEREIARKQQALERILRQEADLRKQGGALTTALGLEQEKYLRVQEEAEQIEARLDYLESLNGEDVSNERSLSVERLRELRGLEAMYQDSIGSISGLLSNYRQKGQTLDDLSLERGFLTQEISDYRASMNRVRTQATGAFAPVQIVEPAVPPIFPAGPSIPESTIGGFAGSLFIAAFVLICIDLLNPMIRTSVNLESAAGESFFGKLSQKVVLGDRGGSEAASRESRSGRAFSWMRVPEFVEAWFAKRRSRELRQLLKKVEHGLMGHGGLGATRLAVAGLGAEALVTGAARAILAGISIHGIRATRIDPTSSASGARTGEALSAPEGSEAIAAGPRTGLSEGPAGPGSVQTGPVELLDLGVIDEHFSLKEAAALNSAMICVVEAGAVDENKIEQVIAASNQDGTADLCFVLLTR